MCVEDAKVLAVNFARNISRKRWGGGGGTKPLTSEGRNQTNEQKKLQVP
jgi:hypothetical protein